MYHTTRADVYHTTRADVYHTTRADVYHTTRADVYHTTRADVYRRQAGGFVEEGESRAVARRGLPAGAASRAFSLADLEAALSGTGPQVVYAERDSAGRLWGARGAAGVAARARLAPHVPARTAALVPAAGGRLRLVAAAALAPHDELLLWPDDALLAAAAVPCLAPRNILPGAVYMCDRCGVRFEQPNPLKVHLYLACEPPRPAAFLRRVLRELASRAPPPPPPPPPPSASPGAPLTPTWPAAWRAAGHACLFCGKLYSRKYGLKIHIRTHTGYKPLRCAHCSRRFGDPSNLNKHVRLHAAAAGRGRAHACPQCGAAHARRRDLLRHVRAHHAAPPAPRTPRAPLAAPG